MKKYRVTFLVKNPRQGIEWQDSMVVSSSNPQFDHRLLTADLSMFAPVVSAMLAILAPECELVGIEGVNQDCAGEEIAENFRFCV